MGEVLHITVDRREAASVVPTLLSRTEGVSIDWAVLRTADYSIGQTVGIERKTATDFAKSVFDGRLFSQVSRLRQAYDRPLLVVEEFLLQGKIAGVSRAALSGALVSVTTSFGVPVLFSSGFSNNSGASPPCAQRMKPSSIRSTKLAR